MSQPVSGDRIFLAKLGRFLAALVAVFVLLGLVLNYVLQGTEGFGYLALFFIVVFGLPVGVLAVFVIGREKKRSDDV